MPELPEVEVTRLSLAHRIAGARIESVRVGKALRWPLGIAAQALAGRTVRAVRRRGKYLLVDLDAGMLLLHLGMSGSLSFAATQPAPGAHDHFDMVTTRGVLRLNDPRRFGAVVYAASEDSPQAVKLLGRLGVEPLTDAFEPAGFHAGLKRRHAPVKQVLLAGDLVVGVGNIYASEALFLAGIRPTLRASRISRPAPPSCMPPCATCWPARSPRAAAPCVIFPMPTARRVTSSSRPWSMTGPGNRAVCAALS